MSPDADNVDNAALDDILAEMNQMDLQKQNAETPTDGTREHGAAESSTTGSTESTVENVDNSTLDDIIAASSKEAAPDETESHELGDLLLDATTAPDVESESEELQEEGRPDRATLESMLTEVKSVPDEETPAVPAVNEEKPEKQEAPPAPAPSPPEPKPVAQVAAAPAARSDRRGVLLLGGILAVNSIGIFVLAGAVLFARPRQSNGIGQLIGVLREDLQERRSVVEEQGTDTVVAEIEQAGQLFDGGQYDEALPLLRRTSRAVPSRSDLAWKTAVSLIQLKRWQEATEALRDFTRRFPDNKVFPDALMRIGECYEGLGLYDHARKAYYQVIGFSGRFTQEQQQFVPAAYDKIAGSYKTEAVSLAAARAINDENE